jgi:hypothetical protein
MERIMKSWVRIILVGLCVGAVFGPLLSTADARPNNKATGRTHKKSTGRTHKKATATGRRHKKLGATGALGATGDCGVGSLATWMADLAPCLQDRKLGQIVIPQSHDSATSGLDYPAGFVPYAQAQDEDLTHQLNGGIRALDVRVEYTNIFPLCVRRCPPARPDYYAHHGQGFLDVFDDQLTLSGILTSIEQWALAGGREHEVILLNLDITQNGAAFPTGDCQSFGQALGSALVTPNQLQSSFGTTDPSQVTLSQLWSLPDPQGAARVLMNDAPCMDAADPSAGQWSTWSSGYYANQCTANGKNPPADQSSGFQSLDLGAAHRRATAAGGGEPYTWGPAAVGGFYELDIQGTPQSDCLVTPLSMLADDEQVLAALYSQWQSDPATKQNLNIVAEDFVEQTDLVKDALAMDGSLFGPFTGAPAAFIDSSGNYNVFVTTGRGLNHYEKTPGGPWGGEEIASGSPFTTAPAAFEDSSGNYNVFVTTGGGLNHYEKTPGDHPWGSEEIASGTGDTGRPAAFEDSSGNYNVFVVTGGGLIHYEKTPGGPWGGEVIASGSPFTTGPAAFEDSSGNYNVFVTMGGGLNHYEKTPGGRWGGEEIASGTGDTGRPAAFVDSSGNYNVFVVTGFGGLIHYEKAPGGHPWGGEVIDSGAAFTAPAAFVDSSGNYNVFVDTGAGLNQYEKAPGKPWVGGILAGLS